ncbi:helix-turn-helix domain-containing protein [Corynebacterium sp. H127]|uniref:helix-turn-helix transcriptional regulator n=1 Tax=Corynebacterium sp. H127 TaxID=3133418 RepID=UPI0030AC8B56
MSPKFMTGAEVQGHLRISRSTLRRWVNEGRLGQVRLSPRKIVYRTSDVNNLVADGIYKVA